MVNKNGLSQRIEIPEGIEVRIEDNTIFMKKDDKELERIFGNLLNVKIENGEIIIKTERDNKNTKKIFGTMKAHFNNMIRGLTDGFIYKMEIANVHFPMTAEIDTSKNELIVKNFLGEKKDRRIKLVEGAVVTVNKEHIEITSPNIEKAGQAAANIEKGTKVRNKDRRIFQDGIFITEKPRRIFE